MANLYGTNAKLLNNFPPGKIPKGDLYGQVHMLYDSYTLAGALNDGDLINIGKIPPGARLVDAIIFSDDIDGSLAMGVIAAGKLEEGAAGADVGEMIASTAVASAVVLKMSSAATNPLLMAKTTDEIMVGIKCTATTTAVAGTIRAMVLYVMD